MFISSRVTFQDQRMDLIYKLVVQNHSNISFLIIYYCGILTIIVIDINFEIQLIYEQIGCVDLCFDLCY